MIIVGAGIAGLTAANLLSEAGHNVKIFEATHRVGGRVQTYRDLAAGWQSELGAMRLPKHHKFVHEAIKRYNLTLAEFHNFKQGYHVHGRLIDQQVLEGSGVPKELNHFFDTFNIGDENDEERQKAGDLILEALQEPLRDFKKMPWKKMLKKYDKYSMKHWLANYANLTEEVRRK